MPSGAVRYVTDPAPFQALESLYLRVREKEGRLLTVPEVRKLPRVEPGSAHEEEWRAREQAALHVLRHLKARRSRRILELGCGCGWLSARLASELAARVTGVDVNRSELELAAQSFAGREGLDFVFGDVLSPSFELGPFDAIVLSAALQYFPDPVRLCGRLFELLEPGGEVVVSDTPLYPDAEVLAARQRTERYYRALGFPEMAAHYRHHRFSDLEPLRPLWLFRPDTCSERVWRTLGRARPVFPILSVRRPGDRDTTA